MPSPESQARIEVRVRPGAGRTRVGGVRGEPPRLLVEVAARAVDGRATQAALVAVAEALGVRPRQVRLVSGATARDKVIEVEDPPADLGARLAALREGAARGR
jgi:uncharacterized protein YggU (UPF0235/DUF167 family)